MKPKITPNLWFDTEAEEAAEFYTSVFKNSRILDCESQEEADYFWERLARGGQEGQCGWLKDRYGVSWQVVPQGVNELFADSDPGRARRAMEAMLTMGRLDLAALRAAADGVAT